MEQAYTAAIGGGVFLFMLTWLVVWSRRDTVWRHIAMVALLPMWLVLAVLIADALGHHRPLEIAWNVDGESRVLAAKMVQGEAIYLYVETGDPEPTALVLPWDDKVAEQLQEAMRKSAESGQQGALMRYKHSWDTNPPQFHPLPIPPLPIPKGRPPEPERYERSA